MASDSERAFLLRMDGERGTEANMRRKPKKGEGRGNNPIFTGNVQRKLPDTHDWRLNFPAGSKDLQKNQRLLAKDFRPKTFCIYVCVSCEFQFLPSLVLKCLRAHGLLGSINPISGKSPLDETTKLEYHAESVLHGYWTSGSGSVGGTSRHGIWLLRIFFGEWSPANGVFLLATSRLCNCGRLGENISEALVAASKPKFKNAPIKLSSVIRNRNRVRRFWQRSRDPALENELRTISNEIASDIRHLSGARWEKTIEELSPETGTLWRRISFLKKNFHHISPPLKGALGSFAVAPIEKAEVIADSLQKQYEPNTDVENPRFSAHTQRKVQRFLDSLTCMDL
ncbi:uncharacterized protein TNCV_2935621 [Trichonephila clavipes]|nr:uncharacterized protein TNCV_2935621 [Trichonephila clavipes]